MKCIRYLLLIIVFSICLNANPITPNFKNDNIIFIPNQGQYQDNKIDKILYKADYNGGYVYLRKNGLSFVLFQENKLFDSTHNILLEKSRTKSRLTHRIDIDFKNMNPNSWIEKQETSKEYFNYYLNNKKITNLFGYSKIIYHNIYEGIDLVVYTNNIGELEYDFVVNANSDISNIKLYIKDSDKSDINSKGELVINSLLGQVTKNKPKAYQNKQSIDCNYVLNSSNEVTFNIADYDKSKELIIDPVNRIWATYYGGSSDEAIYGIKTNSKKEVVISGFSSSNADIASNGYQNTIGGYEDAFISKFDSNGVRIWATYYGGSNYDDAYDIAIDNENNIIIVGETASDSSISTMGSHQEKYGGGIIDGFVAKFDNDGKIIWATYYGGKDEDKINGVAIDDFNNVYVCGYTKSTNGIFYQGYQKDINGAFDGFVAKFNPLGELNWGTYFGGNKDDYLNKIVVDKNRDIIALGVTESTTNIFYQGYQMFLGGSNDAFLVKFTTGGNRKWSTYYGGPDFDSGNSIVCDENNNIYFTGSTKSTYNIAKEGYQNTKSELYDAYICKLDSSGMCKWGTYLGGTGNDFGYSLAYNNAYILFAGTSNSTSQMSYLAFQEIKSGGTDGLFAKYDTNGKLFYCSFYGAFGNDDLRACSWNNNSFYLGGFTNSTGNLAYNGYQNSLKGQDDGLLSKFVDTYFKLDSVKGNCTGAIDSIQILTNIAFTNSNLFSIQISDSAGKFDNPIVIGKFPSVGSTKVKVTYPNNLKSSANYKLRAIASDPNLISEESNKFILSGLFTINLPKDTMCYSESSLTITANDLNIFKYKWYINNGTINYSNEGRSISANLGKPNSISEITVVKSFGDCSFTFTKSIFIKDVYPFEVIGPRKVCENKVYEYSIDNPNIKNVLWEAVDGQIVGDNNKKTVSVKWSSQYPLSILFVSVVDKNDCPQGKIVEVSYNRLDTTKIYGANKTCNGCEETYFATIDTSKFNLEWVVANGAIIGSNAKSQVKIKWDIALPNAYVALKTIDKTMQCDLTNIYYVNLSPNPQIDFSPKRDTVCELVKEILFTSSGNNIHNQWIINDGEKTITIDSNIASFVWQKVGNGKIKLIKTNDSTKYKDSIEKAVYIVGVPKNEAIISSSSKTFCPNDTIVINVNYKMGLLYKFSLVSEGTLNQFNLSDIQSRTNQVRIPLNTIIQKSEKVNFVTKISYGNLDCSIYYDTIPMYFVKETISVQISKDTIFASKGFDNYQWFNNGIKINGATNDYYVPNESAEYTVETKYIDCIASAKIKFTKLGIDDIITDNSIHIYPNPSDGELQIVTDKIIYKYIITNSIGKIEITDYDIKHIDLSKLSNGFYNIILFTNEEIYTLKFQLLK